MSDNKLRRVFVVHYRDGGERVGILYAEGNIQMEDGELVARLDHLVTSDVSHIEFSL